MPEEPTTDSSQATTDVVVAGGGVAALWTAQALRRAGHRVLVFTDRDWGSGQTLAAQGVIHGGLKYALAGKLTESSESLAGMPERWSRALAGEGDADLRAVTVLSPTQILWSLPGAVSQIVAFFGSQALRNRATPLRRGAYPPPFDHPDYRGRLFELGEQVLDPVSLVTSLAVPLAESSWVWPADGVVWERDASGDVTAATFPDRSGNRLRIQARWWVFAAGAGNAGLLRGLGRTQPEMQRRPLHQVVIRHPDLPPLYSVCIGSGAKPPVVTTTHFGSDGCPLWYVGGELAETGIHRSEGEQIDFSRKRFAELLPWLDLRGADWGTVRVDRAEPRTGTGERPPGAFVHREGNVLTAWPTKLALAPDLADQVLRHLGPSPGDVPRSGTVSWDLPRPRVGKAPWDLWR
jgi:glycerol-3-phosphate dehydrogenase